MAAAGTLAAPVQKLSVRIVRWGGLISGLQTICNVLGYLGAGCMAGLTDIKHLCCVLSNCCGTIELN